MSAVADPVRPVRISWNMMSLKIADAAWKLFLQTEEKGGLISCFQNGFIQSEIENSWQKKMVDFNDGKIMVGVNKFKTDEKIVESQSFDTLENAKTDFTAFAQIEIYLSQF